MPRLSIITINFNDRTGLANTIESVINQSFKDIEFIVIDGGSTDSSVDVIKENSKNITYWVSEKDNGIYNAQNKGIEKATGEYCLFLNSGDILNSNDVLQKIVDADLNADIVYGDMMIKWTNGTITYGKMPDKIDVQQMFIDTLWHPVSFIKRSLFHKYGGYDESFKIVADYEFFFKVIIAHKVSTKHVKLPVALYNTNGISSKQEFKALENAERKRVQEKYLDKALLAELISKNRKRKFSLNNLINLFKRNFK